MESGSRAPHRRHLLQDASNAQLCPAGVVQIDGGPAKPFYSGRAMPAGQVDFGLIREWIEFYQEGHTFPNCSHNPDAGVVVTPRFRVINVHKRTVIMAPPAVRYLALSYIYGPPSVTEGLYWTNLADVKSSDDAMPFSVKLPANLPQTIEDAFFVVKELGETYIWIDAYYIFQDDLEEKLSEISNMDRVYGNTVLTIIAGYGEDANTGLSGVQPGSRDSKRQYSEMVNGRRIFISQPCLGEELEHGGDWASRGWTVREGLLSPTCLISTKIQVFWKCSAEFFCESIAEAEKDQRIWTKPALGPSFLSSPMFQLPGRRKSENNSQTPEPRQSLFDQVIHNDLVVNNSYRWLSYESDALNDFIGIVNSMKDLHDTDFFWGLPERAFDAALLWRAESKIFGKKRKRPPFLTWSWASFLDVGTVTVDRGTRAGGYPGQKDHTLPVHGYQREDKGGSPSKFGHNTEKALREATAEVAKWMRVNNPKPDEPDLTGSKSSGILRTAPAIDIDSEDCSKEDNQTEA